MISGKQKDLVPFSHYLEQFPALDPKEVEERLQIPFIRGAFHFRFLNKSYEISHPVYAIRGEGFAAAQLPPQTFLLRWLLQGRESAATEQFLSFSEMPWGEVYQQPFQGRILSRAAFTFGTRPEAFARAAEALAARPIPYGDLAYEFPFLGNRRLRLILWEGDEEFPPAAQLLFSANFPVDCSAEDRVVAAELLLQALQAELTEG